MTDCEVALFGVHAQRYQISLVEFKFRMQIEWFFVMDLHVLGAAARGAARILDEKVLLHGSPVSRARRAL